MDPQARAASFPLLQSRRREAVAYGRVAAAEPHFWAHVHRLLDGGARRVCDIGGGARPIVSLEQIQQHRLEYVVFDKSFEELHKARTGYRVVAGDALDTNAINALVRESGPFDAVFSRWTAEHMRSGQAFHENVLQMLRPGGSAVHLFPTLYALPFLVNRLLSQERSRTLLTRAAPTRKVKFPAYYSWCRGPTTRQLRRLEGLGFTIERYLGFFGHNLYVSVHAAAVAQDVWTKLLVRHPQPALTSFALVVLRRPG
jgi:SAM-dependent methyltransferase